jgi:hypothetical protein
VKVERSSKQTMASSHFQGGDDPNASEIIPDYMNLHSTLPTQAAVEKKNYRIVAPTTAIESTGPISFQVLSGSDEAIYPSEIRIELEIQIRDRQGNRIQFWEAANGADPTAAGYVAAHATDLSKVLPVNGIGHALFSDIEVWLNDTKIASYDGMYAYKADMQCRLFTNSQNKKHSLKSCGFESEDYPFDSINGDAAAFQALVRVDVRGDGEAVDDSRSKTGKIFARRSVEARNSNPMFYIDKIYSEIFNQQKILPPGARLGIKLERHSPEFCLLSPIDGNQYTIKIENMHLKVPIVKIDNHFALQMMHKLYSGENMHFPLRRFECTSYMVGHYVRNLSKDNILVGDITPRRIFVVMVDGDAKNGSYKKDPFNYQHYNLEEIKILISGQLGAVPAIKCDYQHHKGSIKAVHQLLTTLGSEDTNEEVGIDVYNFSKRNNIYAFDVAGFSNELVNGFTKEMRQPTGLDIRLRAALGETICVIIFKEYDAEIIINKSGEVKYLPYA